jgi:hypothetical protein
MEAAVGIAVAAVAVVVAGATTVVEVEATDPLAEEGAVITGNGIVGLLVV